MHQDDLEQRIAVARSALTEFARTLGSFPLGDRIIAMSGLAMQVNPELLDDEKLYTAFHKEIRDFLVQIEMYGLMARGLAKPSVVGKRGGSEWVVREDWADKSDSQIAEVFRDMRRGRH